ncbi:MAG: virulence RhuM family protein [Fibrobacteraceae bacterium]|nr:virulence RhuM family protein [Fibrobacteraceae bacterium]
MSKSQKITPVSIRSSAAEYLTYVAAVGGSEQSLEMRYENENVWLTQKMMAELYGVSVPAINQHIKNILEDGELIENSVIKKYLITANDGKNYQANHYNLQMIIAVGFKVNNERAVQFRKWAGQIVKDYTIQGWVMDKERLKNFGTILTEDYFEKQLEAIREIRISERRFYQKVTDIYSTALDYDPSAKITQDFFKKVQNKLHWAIHGHTAAELILERADSQKENMGLKTWATSPKGKIMKSDVIVAKNYLNKEEVSALELIVSGYLDFAEMQANRHIPMTMEDWAKHLDRILMATEHELLTNAGKISMEVAQAHAITEWEKYRIVQDKLFRSDFDYFLELHEKMAQYKA